MGDVGAAFRLDGKTYAVLGAGGGIGAEVSRVIGGLGGSLLCVDRDEGVLDLAQRLGARGLVADVTTEAGIDAVAEATHGVLDGYLDVVGRMGIRTVGQTSMADWEDDFTLNLRHAVLAGRRLAPLVAARGGGGSIVHVSSAVGSRAGAFAPGYGAAKAALESWTRTLAQAHGRAGVRVNAVAPTLFRSPRFLASPVASGAAGSLAERTMLGRLGEPHEVAGVMAFLLTPAAGYLTGQVIAVDGGALHTDGTGLHDALGLA